MKYSIRITRQALAHLREIRRYIEEELAAPDAALNTIRAIRTEIAKLSYMPQKIQARNIGAVKLAGEAVQK